MLCLAGARQLRSFERCQKQFGAPKIVALVVNRLVTREHDSYVATTLSVMSQTLLTAQCFSAL